MKRAITLIGGLCDARGRLFRVFGTCQCHDQNDAEGESDMVAHGSRWVKGWPAVIEIFWQEAGSQSLMRSLMRMGTGGAILERLVRRFCY